MADSNVLLKVTNYKTEPVETGLRSGIDGALVTQDWIDAMDARGYGWNIGIGSGTTPVAGGGAGTVQDPDQPMLVIDIPSNRTLVPVRFDITLETPLIGSDDEEIESHIFVDEGALSAATAAVGTAEAAWNSRLDAAGVVGGSGLNIVSAITTNLAAAPTEDILLSHMSQVADVQGVATTVLWGDYQHLYEPKHPPFISGQATLVVDWMGTVAVSGFMAAHFLVFDSAKINDLV